MSGDVQTRQRRKEKKKQKRDEAPLPGVDTSKFNETEKKSVQMHINESDHHGDHGAGICAKIIFFALMAILLGLVTLIVLENRGGSDVDTPLSESRFSEYLQGWVDENRQDDHHDEPHFSDDHDDHDHAAEESHHDEEHTEINDDEPYPEEKDASNDENDDDENSQELNAEINNNESNQEDDNNDIASQEIEDNNNDDDDVADNNNNDDQPEGSNDNDDDNDGLEDNDNNNNNNDEPEVPNLFEDSAPFDEEDDDDDQIADSKDIFENVVDNDAGEDILLQKLAEESEQEQNQQQEQDENEEEGSSSLMVKLGVGVLLAIVAHQIIIKKISATNRSDTVDAELIAKENENALSKRRFTMLSNSEEQLINDDLDNEEIIEVMMIATPNVVHKHEEEQFTESDIDEDELGEEEEDIIDEELEEEEEEEEYSEEIIDEYEADVQSRVPQTFEEFHNMYKPQSEQIVESIRKVTFDEPKDVEQEVENEVEERILSMPEASNVQATPKSENIDQTEIIQTEEDYEPDIDIEEEEICEEEEELEEEEMSGDELMDEDDLDYEQSDEDLSDIDDSDLLNRLEAKYGKISNSDKSNEEENEDGSWTKIPEGGGAQSSYMEELLRQQALEENY